jgi:hypothetical protein
MLPLVIAKVGIRNLCPQLRKIADNQNDCGVADFKKLRNCDCRPSKFDFRNSTTIRSLLPGPVPFPQLRMVLKINQNFFKLSVYLEIKTCLKGTVAQDF